tara:strand:+ start:6851 stop:7270 length:420 start_codon:yes stop_codon:yes gene_type:complete
MPTQKTIKLTETFLPNISNIDEVKDETQNIVESIYNRFMNEKNYNNLGKTRQALENYRYVHKDWILPQGRFIRYITTNITGDMRLKGGGFILECNKYTFYVFNKYVGKFHICRKNAICFIQLNRDDYMRCSLEGLSEEN